MSLYYCYHFIDYVPNICKDLVNTNCWNGSANVSVNNVMFNNQTIAGQSK